MNAAALIRAGEAVPCRPTPRHVLAQPAWSELVGSLATDPAHGFVALWADTTHVHALFEADTPLLASVAVEAGLYAALSPAIPGAALFERMIADLWGHDAANAIDVRPWLDHGTWSHLRPMSARPVPNSLRPGPAPPEMQAHAGQPITTGPLGPTWTTPATWCVSLEGDTVRNLEARFGWAHRGVLALMRGLPPSSAARLAARIDGAASVAHATAFARASEAALGAILPLAAEPIRGLLLCLEHAAIALADTAAAADALDEPCPAAAHARERLLLACDAGFGHRHLFDLVRPGGVAIEPTADALASLDDALAALPPLDPAGPLASAARLAAATAAIEAARTQLARIPAGPALAPLPHAGGPVEGLGTAMGPHGAVWHWVRLESNSIVANFAAAPEWLRLPALERAAMHHPLADVAPLLAAAGLHPAGMDL